MSGGLYGRGKAPERACMPLQAWPETDRRLWETACTPADVLSETNGARSNHAEISNRKAEKGYGRWLTYLKFGDPGCLADLPAARITSTRVKAYVDCLSALDNSTATILDRLQELGEVAEVVDPDGDWQFIKRMASKVRARHRPARDKSNLKLSEELLALGFELMESASAKGRLPAALHYRDGLMIALLTLLPFRRRNLTGLQLRQNLIETNGQWMVMLHAGETKTHQPLEFELPSVLTAPLETYLSIHQPFLAAREGRWWEPAGNALWVSKDGSPMTEMAIYDRVRFHTKAAFGNPINPHLFRDAAATTMAIADPQHVRVAAPLLGHRTFTTTERHYQHAKGFEAQRAYVDVVIKGRSMK